MPVPTAAAALSPPRRDRQPGGQGQGRRDGGAQPTGDFRTLVEVGEPGARQIERRQDRGRPRAQPHVEQQGARRVGNVGRVFASQPLTDEIFRQQHPCHAGVGLRLLVAQPEDLGGLEAGERGVPGDRDQPRRADCGGDRRALRRRALVVPEEGRADHGVGVVEEDRAVHLAGQAEADNLARAAKLRCDRAYGLPCGPTPLLRVLLGPAGMRRGERVLDRSRGGDHPGLVHGDGARASRADIQSE